MVFKQFIRVIAILSVLFFVSLPSYAENGFGAPFANHAPAALGGADQVVQTDDMNAFLERLSDIEPAAGEEETIQDDMTSKVKNENTDLDNNNAKELHSHSQHSAER